MCERCSTRLDKRREIVEDVERRHKPFMVTDFVDEENEPDTNGGNIEYRDEHINSHSGQHDYELGLYIDDEIVGMVQYTLYDDEITVRDIIVRPEFRRQGHASRMMKYIKEKHPEYEYKPSMKTDLGTKFKHKDVNLEEVIKIVREVLSENVFNEAARRIESLPEGTALFVDKHYKGYALVLYNPKTKDAYATISFSDVESLPHYYVGGVAAERGFGPFIYELAMMVSHKDGKGLMPTRDGDVRGGAWDVWEKFYNREDVKKDTTPFESDEFSFKIFDDHDYLSIEEKEEWLQSIKDDKWMSIESLMVFNTAFSIPPNNQLKELTSRADEWIKKGFDINTAMEAGDDLFGEKYD